jgi:pyruvate formate lyase activating enzyme
MPASGLVFAIERFAVHDGPGIRVAFFLKGCPLRCAWCHSPESQHARQELLIKSDRCLICGTCYPLCPHEAIVATPEGFETDRDRCEGCGSCVAACPSGARSIAGEHISVAEVLRQAERDRVFIERSGGGVTFSGGEPMMQPVFLAEAIAACRAAGFHTAVETSGFGTIDGVDAVATADLILFDLKILDDRRHRHATGISNRVILENFRRLASARRPIRVRVPLVPGFTDDDANVSAIGAFAASHGLREIDLLPYHTAGAAKYARLDRPYALAEVPALPANAVGPARARLEAYGLAVRVGGSS